MVGVTGDWRDDAACKDSPTPDLWHPVGADATMTREKRAQIALAKEVCAGCPVIQQCGALAIADAALTGVWGGMTDGERSRLRSGNLRPCGTDAAYRRHRKRGEAACDPCKAAHNAATKAYS